MLSVKEKLKVCWLKDKRLGHLTKIEGILKALNHHYELEVEEIEICWRPSFLRTCARLLPDSYLYKVLKSHPTNGIELIVSAGGATEWPNAKLAKILKVPNIYIGSCRKCKEVDFTILPRFEGNEKNVLKIEITPSKIDPETVEKAGQLELPDLDSTYWALLLGGDCQGCTWTEIDWMQQLTKIIQEAKQANVKLLVTSSPRSGVQVENICGNLLHRSGLIAKCVWYSSSETDSISISALLGRASRILVSEDSASMINEAVLSGKPVGTISPRSIKLPDRNERMLHQLENKKYILRLRGIDWSFGCIDDNAWNVVSNNWYYDLGKRIMNRINKRNTD